MQVDSESTAHVAQYMVLALLVCMLLAVFIFDFIMYQSWGYNFTVSSIWYKWCTRWPILPFVLGILIGHLLWPGG